MGRPKKRTLKEYMTLDYPMIVTREQDGSFGVEYPDLPGAGGTGKTLKSAMADAETSRKLWIKTSLELGWHIPAPDEPSKQARITLRLPSVLKYRLERRAASEGTSLNSLVTRVLDNLETR